MKILVACEYSGTVRDAFIKKGHEAISCDILPTEVPGPHYQGNVLDILYDGWDMMIAHPPCTYLSWAGNGYFNEEKYGQRAIERKRKREDALQFFFKLYRAPIDKICIENPRGYVERFIKPTQKIHPFYFGDPHKKLTCLWIKGLPRLNGNPDVALNFSKHEPKPIYIDKSGKKRYFCDSIKGKGGGHARSKTFSGIAKAMAEQWGQVQINSSEYAA